MTRRSRTRYAGPKWFVVTILREGVDFARYEVEAPDRSTARVIASTRLYREHRDLSIMFRDKFQLGIEEVANDAHRAQQQPPRGRRGRT